ncbi:MAG: hypothetical protein QGG40_11950 [Myxococcota bacterium]|nr:hypothetical protein [Myxococcota bacterium]
MKFLVLPAIFLLSGTMLSSCRSAPNSFDCTCQHSYEEGDEIEIETLEETFLCEDTVQAEDWMIEEVYWCEEEAEAAGKASYECSCTCQEESC